MRICFLIEKVGPYHAYRLEQLMNVMDVVCIETRPGSERYAWKESQQDAITKTVFSFKGTTYTDLHRLLDQISPSALFVGGYGFKEMLWAMAWGVQNKVPLVMLSDSTIIDEPRTLIKECIKKIIISNCSAAFVAGTRSKEYIQQLGIKANAIFTPYDVIDNSFYAQKTGLASLHEKPYLICVSRLLPQKNLFFLVDVFTNIATKFPVDLLILGNGELETQLQKYIEEKGMNDRIFIKGFLHRNTVRQYYEHAVGLVLASTSEPWGLCVNEAMAAGLPVLVSKNCGSAIDLVKEGENGYTFSPIHVEEASNVLEKFLNLDRTTQQMMGKKGQQFIESYNGFKYQNAINSIIAFIQASSIKSLYFRSARSWFLLFISNKIN